MSGVLRERPFEVVAPDGEVLHAGTSEPQARYEAETAILAGRADRVRIYGKRAELLMEGVRVGPKHVAWYCGDTISHGRGGLNGR